MVSKKALESWFSKGQKRPSKKTSSWLRSLKFPKGTKGFGMATKKGKSF